MASISMNAFYALETYMANKIIFSDKPYETYLSYVRAFPKRGCSKKDWQTESIDSVIDGWIKNSPEIRSALGEKPLPTVFSQSSAAYLHGVDYVLHNGQWDDDWINFANDLVKNGDGDE